MRSFDGRVAAITGAGSGIGRALALALVRRGAAVALADVDAEGLRETSSLISAAGAGRAVSTHVVDVADGAAVEAFAAEVVAAHGRVHVIVNNAGIAAAGTVADQPIETLRRVMDVNFWGVVHGTRAFLPHLRAAGEGHVVNISSVFGLFAQPSQSAYNASKFAVRGYTESLRQELDLLRCGVSATCVHPGGVRTAIVERAVFDPSAVALLGERTATERGRVERHFRTSPEAAAEAILRGVERNARRVLVGVDAHALDLMQRCLPTSHQRLVALVLNRLRT